jgi:hypothetical protein
MLPGTLWIRGTELDGTTIVQVVEHQNADVSYPVIADPYLGTKLFSSITRDRYKGDWRINAIKSRWGQVVHTPTPAGWGAFLDNGWKEITTKYPWTAKSKLTIRQQYVCHVAGGYGNLAGPWNLERMRPDRSITWVYRVHVHRCNWVTHWRD